MSNFNSTKIFETPKVGRIWRRDHRSQDQILLGHHQTYRQEDLLPLGCRRGRGTTVKTADSHQTVQLLVLC